MIAKCTFAVMSTIEQNNYFKDCLSADSRTVLDGVGKNVIPEPKRESLLKQFIEKFKDPIVTILIVVLFLSLGISAYEIIFLDRSASCLIESAGIALAILLSTGIAFIFEVRAEREFKILNKVKDERKVKVLRWKSSNSKTGRPEVFEIKRADVVKGDIVYLENGDEIPADGYLVKATTLRVDESAFTGELFTTKTAEPDGSAHEEAYPKNFLIRGTTVIEGNAVYKVSAVGPDTEEGKGAKILQEEPTVETPLNQQLGNLAKWITRASYLFAALIVIGRTVLFFATGKGGDNFNAIEFIEMTLSSIMLAVTLIVVAVPEGLPMSVTISLALSMRKMLKEKNLVRKLHACETLGAATVICTDKTGTLTQNKMKVVKHDFYGPDLDFFTECISVNSTAEVSQDEESGDFKIVGNPTEGAILRWLVAEEGKDYKTYREALTVLSQKPFTTERKSMETTARNEETGRVIRYIKGAPEVILGMADTVPGTASKEDVRKELAEYQNQGMRTLGFAYQVIEDGRDNPVIYIGHVGIADPVREDVKDAIAICRNQAGIRVIMVTGDVSLTANEIAHEVGIVGPGEDSITITGAEFAEMSDEKLKTEVLPKLTVLSRARPEDKARLVTLLQEMGHVVGVTGDGTNDAPALKKAQVGLSMGDGTSRAKEASDITIIDNSFSSINTGILWGRSLYQNIKRFILFQMTINVCACLIVLFGAFIGLDSPLTVTQMLWVNLIMDTFAAMALSSLPPDRKVMTDKPRDQKKNIIDRKMGCQIAIVGIIFFVILAVFWQILYRLDIDSVRQIFTGDSLKLLWRNLGTGVHDSDVMTSYERGIFFSTFVIAQFWNLFNARYFRTGRSLIGDIGNIITKGRKHEKEFGAGFFAVLAIILLGQVLIVNVCSMFFEVAPLSFDDWCYILGATSLIMIIPDIFRFVRSLAKPKGIHA